eukprot:627076-Lingulodinium_polyedra.AAC.1
MSPYLCGPGAPAKVAKVSTRANSGRKTRQDHGMQFWPRSANARSRPRAVPSTAGRGTPRARDNGP